MVESNENTLLTNNEENKIQQATSNLTKNTEDLVENILSEDDPKKIKDLTQLFNIAQTKKTVLRTLSYNNLLDRVNDQMEERLCKRADQFSNKDLLDYMDKISNAMDKAQKQIKDVDTTPAIQINQQNIIMDGAPELSRESRQNIMDAVSAILKGMESSSQNIEEIDEETVSDNDSINDNGNEDTLYSQNGDVNDETSYLSEEDILNINNNFKEEY